VFFTEGPVPLPDIAMLTDERGEFSLSAPAAGTYRIKCVVEGNEPVEVESVVRAGTRQELEIRLT